MCRIEGSLPIGKSAAHASPCIFWNQVLTLTALTSRLSVMWAACLENGRVFPSGLPTSVACSCLQVTVGFRLMTGDPRALSAARAGVARAVAAEPGRLRRCSASVLLAFTSAAALAPLLVAGGPALATAALAGVAGNVGSGMLTNVLDRAIARLGGEKPGLADTDAIRDDLAAELRTALHGRDASARDLSEGLFDLLIRVGGVEAAIDAAADDVSGNVLVCFRQLAGQQGQALSRLQAIEAGQRRQERRQRDHSQQIEEMNDRLRQVTGLLAACRN